MNAPLPMPPCCANCFPTDPHVPLKLSKLFTCVSGEHRAHQHTSRGLTLHLNFFPSLILYAMLLSLSVVAYVCVLLLCCAITAGLLAPSTDGPCQLPSIVETPQPPQTKSNSCSHQYRRGLVPRFLLACTHKLKVGWYLSMQRWFYYSYKLLRHILALSSTFKPASSKASADDIARVMFLYYTARPPLYIPSGLVSLGILRFFFASRPNCTHTHKTFFYTPTPPSPSHGISPID